MVIEPLGPLNVVLADDHVLFLHALAAVFRRRGDAVVATVTTCAGLIVAAQDHDGTDLFVVDRQLADGDALEVIGELRSVQPGARVVVLTADTGAGVAERVDRAGAHGYVHKSQGLDATLDLVRRSMAVTGMRSHPHLVAVPAPPRAQARPLAALTQREQQCLNMLRDGMDTAAMARTLGVSAATVRAHLRAIFTKLGVHSRLEAMAVATAGGR